ncbi:MAG: chemotaxis response regulator protein-glutamate methylesterase [Pseudomonadota bacterium]
MLVDDSAVTRGLVSRILESDQQIDVVASVNDGQMAINSLRRTPVDVIVLDVEMPVMDGLTALPQLIEIDPAARIIVLSTLTKQNATTTVRALQMGAAECMLKPSSSREINSAEDFKSELIRKSKALCISARKKGVRPSDPKKRRPRPKLPHERKAEQPKKVEIKTRASTNLPVPDVIAIGSSTGGPQALFEVLKALKDGTRQPVFITQHMPGTFTNILANHIARQCEVDCVEAEDGAPVIDGRVYVAPGGYHMTVVSREGQQFIELNQDPPENFCRPAVDPMMRSLVNVYGRRVLALILTGMGQDGLKGCQAVVDAGGTVLAQDEDTSVVWGMPGAVANAGICSEIIPLPEIGPKLYNYATRLKG